MGFTLHDKIWNDHVVHEERDGTCLLYVDRHLLDEVDSPQAFSALRLSGARVKAPEKTLLVVDHNISTSDRRMPNSDPEHAGNHPVQAMLTWSGSVSHEMASFFRVWLPEVLPGIQP